MSTSVPVGDLNAIINTTKSATPKRTWRGRLKRLGAVTDPRKIPGNVGLTNDEYVRFQVFCTKLADTFEDQLR